MQFKKFDSTKNRQKQAMMFATIIKAVKKHPSNREAIRVKVIEEAYADYSPQSAFARLRVSELIREMIDTRSLRIDRAAGVISVTEEGERMYELSETIITDGWRETKDAATF